METLQETLRRYDAEALLTSNLWMRYNALVADVRNILRIYERSMRTLPDDLEWNGMDRDEIAETIAYGLTGSHRNSTVTYALSMMSTFTLSAHTGSDMIHVMGWRDGRDAVLATITLTRPDGDGGPLFIRYEINDPTMRQYSLKVILPYDMAADKPKARLEKG